MNKYRNTIPKALKLQIFDRDNDTCHYCGKHGIRIMRYGKPCVIENPNNIEILDKTKNYNGADIISFEIDHVIPLYLGGISTLDNLVLSCRKCNRQKAHGIGRLY